MQNFTFCYETNLEKISILLNQKPSKAESFLLGKIQCKSKQFAITLQTRKIVHHSHASILFNIS